MITVLPKTFSYVGENKWRCSACLELVESWDNPDPLDAHVCIPMADGEIGINKPERTLKVVIRHDHAYKRNRQEWKRTAWADLEAEVSHED